MEKIIDVSKKIVSIECPNCGHVYHEAIEVLLTKGTIKCPKCETEYILKLK